MGNSVFRVLLPETDRKRGCQSIRYRYKLFNFIMQRKKGRTKGMFSFTRLRRQARWHSIVFRTVNFRANEHCRTPFRVYSSCWNAWCTILIVCVLKCSCSVGACASCKRKCSKINGVFSTLLPSTPRVISLICKLYAVEWV